MGYLFNVATPEAEPITGEDLAKSATEAKESAAGTGHWGPGDLKKLSPLAYESVAEM